MYSVVFYVGALSSFRPNRILSMQTYFIIHYVLFCVCIDEKGFGYCSFLTIRAFLRQYGLIIALLISHRTEGTAKNKLSKKQVISSNIKDMWFVLTLCFDSSVNVIHPKCGPLALRLSAVLLLGITRIHNVLFLLYIHCRDSADTYYPIQMMFLDVSIIKLILKN